MTDALPDWDRSNPFEDWRPTPGESASAAELWQYCLTDDPRFGEVFNTICAGVLLEKSLPQVLAAVLLHGRDMIEGNCSDRELAHTRLAAGVRSARDDALVEAAYRDYT